jgi:hypothetical protein
MIGDNADHSRFDSLHLNRLNVTVIIYELRLSTVHFHLGEANEFYIVVLEPLALRRLG